jgi:hypothetical protein
MALASAAAWIGWVFVIHSVDPINAGALGFLLFYVTIFIAMLGTTVFFGTLIRLWLRPKEVTYRHTLRSFRQGIILSCLFLAALFLLSFELLRWWSGTLLVILFSFVELVFVSRRSEIGNRKSDIYSHHTMKQDSRNG